MLWCKTNKHQTKVPNQIERGITHGASDLPAGGEIISKSTADLRYAPSGFDQMSEEAASFIYRPVYKQERTSSVLIRDTQTHTDADSALLCFLTRLKTVTSVLWSHEQAVVQKKRKKESSRFSFLLTPAISERLITTSLK